MYQKILVALDATTADESILAHVTQLAKRLDSTLLLFHVADGWAARNYETLQLAESEEMKEDRAYLERTATNLRANGVRVETRLGLGEPPKEVLKTAQAEHCDLIAMTSHGHKLFGDIVFGSTIEAVRHASKIPMLIVRSAEKPVPLH